MFCGTRAWGGMVCGFREPERVCNTDASAISWSCLLLAGLSVGSSGKCFPIVLNMIRVFSARSRWSLSFSASSNTPEWVIYNASCVRRSDDDYISALGTLKEGQWEPVILSLGCGLISQSPTSYCTTMDI